MKNTDFKEFFSFYIGRTKLQESKEDDIGDVSEFEQPHYWRNLILRILDRKGIDYTLNPETGLYDVNGNVDLNNYSLESLEDTFGTVSGNFECQFNYLTSLEGAPQKVGGGFDCSFNKLKSLIGGPKVIMGALDCENNPLVNLQGFPEYLGGFFYSPLGRVYLISKLPIDLQSKPLIEVEAALQQHYSKNKGLMFQVQESTDNEFGDISEFEKPTYWTNRVLKLLKEKNINYTINPETGLYDVDGNLDLSYLNLESFGDIKFGIVNGYFNCSQNSLTSLEGAPRKVAGYFSCSINKLISLKGAPKYVKKNFFCYRNSLITLEGAPDFIGGDFSCDNNFLTSLEGAPDFIGGDFSCDNNFLTSLEGAPKYIGGDFYCTDNKLTSLGDIESRVKGEVFANDNPLNILQESGENDVGDVSEFEEPKYSSNIPLKSIIEDQFDENWNDIVRRVKEQLELDWRVEDVASDILSYERAEAQSFSEDEIYLEAAELLCSDYDSFLDWVNPKRLFI